MHLGDDTIFRFVRKTGIVVFNPAKRKKSRIDYAFLTFGLYLSFSTPPQQLRQIFSRAASCIYSSSVSVPKPPRHLKNQGQKQSLRARNKHTSILSVKKQQLSFAI